RSPEPEDATAATATDPDDESTGMKHDAPGDSLVGVFGPEHSLALAGEPIDEHDERFSHAGECVRDLGDPRTRQEPAVGTEGHAADAANVGAKRRVVLEKFRGVHLANQFS